LAINYYGISKANAAKNQMLVQIYGKHPPESNRWKGFFYPRRFAFKGSKLCEYIDLGIAKGLEGLENQVEIVRFLQKSNLASCIPVVILEMPDGLVQGVDGNEHNRD
jgi:hypothetical protein